jgi:hypothetical protein
MSINRCQEISVLAAAAGGKVMLGKLCIGGIMLFSMYD